MAASSALKACTIVSIFLIRPLECVVRSCVNLFSMFGVTVTITLFAPFTLVLKVRSFNMSLSRAATRAAQPWVHSARGDGEVVYVRVISRERLAQADLIVDVIPESFDILFYRLSLSLPVISKRFQCRHSGCSLIHHSCCCLTV